MQDLNAAIPTITFDVKDGLGHDLTSVDVAVDERPSVKLSGSPLVLNPGAHRFKFAAEGQPSVSLSFVLHEGDKGRRERVTIGAPPVEKPAALPTPVVSLPPVREEPPKVTRQHGKTQMILGLASGAVGLVGLGVGTTFGLKSFSAKSNQIVTCTVASCDASQHSQALTDRSNVNTYSTISTAAFGVGGVFLVGGVVMLLTTPRSQEVRAPSAVVVVPSVGSGGGGLLVQGEF